MSEFWVSEFWVSEFWVSEFWVSEFWVSEFWVRFCAAQTRSPNCGCLGLTLGLTISAQ